MGKPAAKEGTSLDRDREKGGGFNVLRLAASTAAAGGYTFALLRWAVPPGGMAAATPAFYSGVSLQLPAAVTAAYLAMCSFGPKLKQHMVGEHSRVSAQHRTASAGH